MIDRKSSSDKKLFIAELNYLAYQLEKYATTFNQALILYDSINIIERKIFAIENLKKSINQFSDSELMVEVQKILSLQNDGHSGTSLLFDNFIFNNSIEYILPLYFEFFGQELWCIGVYGQSNSKFINTRLLSFNGFSVAEIFDKFKSIIGYDNIFNARSKFQKHISSVAILKAIGVVRKNDTNIFITTESIQGGLNCESLSYINKNTYHPDYSNLLRLAENPEIPTNRFITSRDLMIYEIPEINSICVKISTLRLSEEQKDNLYSTLKIRIENVKPRKIIIDYRGNEGGTGFLNDKWIEMLIEYGKNDSNLIVITDIHTFSLATKQAAWLKLEGNALLIGEPSGGNFLGYSSPKTYTMKSLNLSYNLTTEHFNDSKKFDLSEIAMRISSFELLNPDKEIYPSVFDFIEGKDPIFRYISSL